MYERYEMTKLEKSLYEGNLKLVDEKREMLKDIKMLIQYINGNKDIKKQVDDIIKYYRCKNFDKVGFRYENN